MMKKNRQNDRIFKKGWLARLKGYKACSPQADKLVGLLHQETRPEPKPQ